ncbi:ADP-ribosylglycohydrolase family protein [Niveibacterium sp. 24ML]|uniref:ADP-ribosylglycohydrolase family protein n=1 Tax=Niveibacterium sp. 24ML TaxID=2985512 RepID=UPI00226E8E8E|nr:ADP-ribosylglycohydrolase family protein [Niveibacterium sp. 24ML]MCX9154664.1 ADP-ribosylglycohydrolase family protein [Niveibacterium sp. 24ML]
MESALAACLADFEGHAMRWPAASMSPAIIDRACGCLLGLALGDALGATVEFMTPREIRAQYGTHARIRGGGWLRLPSGAVTDDTGMALALADCLIAHHEPAAADYARAFDTWMRSKPVDIGNTVRRGISRFRRSGEACAPPSDDAGNGATMRCAPAALAFLAARPAHLAEHALAQARVTHHCPLTDAATLAVVFMVRAAVLGAGIGAVMALAHTLVRHFPAFGFRGRQVENPSGYIVDTLCAVLQAIDYNDNARDALIDVVNRGGDADTTGAIAGCIAGALDGAARLPADWLDALDPRIGQQCGRAVQPLLARSLPQG